jgi:membrane fusion protein, heavy metal efflux system
VRTKFACLLAGFLFVLGAVPATAHEGHDHDKPAASAGSGLPRGSIMSDDFQIVAILKNGELHLYLDRTATNEPVTNAAIEAETPDGPAKAEHQSDGSYRLSASWAKPDNKYELIFTVTAEAKVDVLALSVAVPTALKTGVHVSGNSWIFPILVAFGIAGAVFVGVRKWPHKHSRKAAAIILIAAALSTTALANGEHGHGTQQALSTARDVPQRQPDGSAFVPKPTQRLLAIRTTAAKAGEHFRSAELPGRIISDPNASGYVQSALSGRLSPPPKGFPSLGSKVQKGDVLAYVTPPIQAIDISDMRQKEGELLQQISIVERRVARFERLAKTGAISKAQFEEAKLELGGLQERRVALEQTRREPEILVAPVSGVISAANTVAGQLAQPNTIIFEIIDTSRLWVEALTFEPIQSAAESSARLSNGRSLKLSFRGAGLSGRNQAIPVHFAVNDSTEGLWAGQFVTVYASGTDRLSGIALPRAAVVRASSGQHIVYEHTAPETFEPREVRISPLDAERVLVLGGLKEGQRIVIQGAELIEQVR